MNNVLRPDMVCFALMTWLALLLSTTTSDAAGVHCPRGEMTNALLVNDGQHYYISDCKIHDGGSITVTNGSLFLERVEIVIPYGSYIKVLTFDVSKTSAAVNFTMMDSDITPAAANGFPYTTPIVIIGNNAPSNGKHFIKISNNRFTDILYKVQMSSITFGAGSTVDISNNVGASTATVVDEYRYWSYWCYVDGVTMDGGRILLNNNRLALDSSFPDGNFGAYMKNVKLGNATPSSVISVFNNSGVYPALYMVVSEMEVNAGYDISVANNTVNATNTVAVGNATTQSFVTVSLPSPPSHSSTAAATLPTSLLHVYSNDVHMRWSIYEDDGVSFAKCYYCNRVIVHDNDFAVEVRHASPTGGPMTKSVPLAKLTFAVVEGGVKRAPAIAQFVSNRVVFVVPRGMKGSLVGIEHDLSNFHSTIQSNHFNFSGPDSGLYFTAITNNGVDAAIGSVLATGNSFVSTAALKSSFMSLLGGDFHLAPGHALRIEGNTIVLLSTPSVPPLIDYSGFQFIIAPPVSGLPNPIFTVSSNIVGSSAVCDADTIVPFGNFTGDVANLTATGCLNKICDVNMLSLSDKYAHTNVSWVKCPRPPSRGEKRHTDDVIIAYYMSLLTSPVNATEVIFLLVIVACVIAAFLEFRTHRSRIKRRKGAAALLRLVAVGRRMLSE